LRAQYYIKRAGDDTDVPTRPRGTAAVLDQRPRPNHCRCRPYRTPTRTRNARQRRRRNFVGKKNERTAGRGRRRRPLGDRMLLPTAGRWRRPRIGNGSAAPATTGEDGRPDEQTSEAHASVEHGVRRDRRRVESASAQPRGIEKQIENRAAVLHQLDRVVFARRRQIRQVVGGVGVNRGRAPETTTLKIF